MSFNFAVALRERRLSHPEAPLCHLGESTFTYEQVDEISGRVAAALRDLGLERGDRVAVQLPNLPHFLFSYFAILKAGLVMVPVNPLLKAREIDYHLRDSGARLLITFETCAAEAVKGAAEAGGVQTFMVTLPGSAAKVDGVRSFDELYAAHNDGEIEPTAADDTAVLLYTSGTTGRPKGAELTHFQLYMGCTIPGEIFGYRQDDVTLAVLPLFHVFGLSNVLNLSVRYGGSVALVPRFETEAVLDTFETHQCTVFVGVPTMFSALLHADIGERDLSAFRVGVSGGAAIPGEMLRAFEEKFNGVPVLEGYGLSETVGIVSFNTGAESRKVLSVGTPIWGVEVRILGPEGNALPAGEPHVGEIAVRGHNVMKGYFGRPEETAQTLRGGWLRTGDLGYRDFDGYLFIVDRKKDLVIRGGYNVYPREVEEILHAHPAVAEAAVIGRPDERLGEEVVAVVSLRPGSVATSEELIEHCRQQLAAYKYPREIRIVESLPKGPTGKILKTALRSA
jgi:long-chain acyl-CoA synthetase